MDEIEIKKQLHDYIEDADDRLLRILYGIVIADKTDIPDWHKTILNERLEEYDRDPTNVISWEDLKAKIEKMR
jgi:hypothetical protein